MNIEKIYLNQPVQRSIGFGNKTGNSEQNNVKDNKTNTSKILLALGGLAAIGAGILLLNRGKNSKVAASGEAPVNKATTAAAQAVEDKGSSAAVNIQNTSETQPVTMVLTSNTSPAGTTSQRQMDAYKLFGGMKVNRTADKTAQVSQAKSGTAPLKDDVYMPYPGAAIQTTGMTADAEGLMDDKLVQQMFTPKYDDFIPYQGTDLGGIPSYDYSKSIYGYGSDLGMGFQNPLGVNGDPYDLDFLPYHLLY